MRRGGDGGFLGAAVIGGLGYVQKGSSKKWLGACEKWG